MLMLSYLSFLMFSIGLIVFSFKSNHLLLVLLSLEFMVLSLYFYIMLFLMQESWEFFFSMVFLTFSVCEGALGLSILVSMIRTHGNDYFQSFNLLW
nr:NADH dehydrogenase subunit 4L [Habroloma sp.]